MQRDISGQAQLMIVKANQTAETRPVSLGQLYKGFYVVNSGIKAGEKVIVEGHDRIQQPEQPLKITQWKSQYTTDVGTLQTQNKGSDQSTAGQSSPNTGEKL